MVENNEVIEHVEIGRGTYRNFSGNKTDYNKAGSRTFSIFLPQDIAEYLTEQGWYVKTKPPKSEEYDIRYQMDIAVGFDKWPPMITLISADGSRSFLNEDNVSILDTADIEDATVEIRPYNWEVNGKTGCKAYLKELSVKLRPPRRTLNGRLRHDHDDDEEDPF